MNDQRFPELAIPMTLAARELRLQSPPATLLPAIHRRLASAGVVRSRSSRIASWAGWSALSAACVAVAVVLVVNSLPEPEAAAPLSQDSSGFVTLASNEAWQQAAAVDSGRVWLVSTEISQARLAALGLPFDPSNAGDRVPAQLLMQGSGDVLAVRVNQ